MGGLFSKKPSQTNLGPKEAWEKVHRVCGYMTETECRAYEELCSLDLYDVKRPKSPSCNPDSLSEVNYTYNNFSMHLPLNIL